MSGKCIKTGKSRKRNAVKHLPLLDAFTANLTQYFAVYLAFKLLFLMKCAPFLYQFGGILGIAFICYIVYNTLALYP